MKRPFWIHQLVEYLLAIALLSQGLRAAEPLVPTVLGVLLLVNVAVVDGPLSAWKAVSRRVHRLLDVALTVILVGATFLPGSLVASSTRVLIAGAAAVMAFMVWRSDYTERARRPPVRASGGRAEEVGRLAGRAVGHGVNTWRQVRRTDASSSPDSKRP